MAAKTGVRTETWTQYETGELHLHFKKSQQFSFAEKQAAVEHYLEHGRNYSRTVRMLGYPNRETLRSWCKELAPVTRKVRRGAIKYSQEQKKEVVSELIGRQISAKKIAKQSGISRKTLYAWKSELVGRDFPLIMPNQSTMPQEELKSEVEDLKKQIYQLKMEKEILERTAELIKKDQGINPINLKNKEKTILIDALRVSYPLTLLLRRLELAKSNYYYHKSRLALPDKYALDRALIIDFFKQNDSRYGYRRIHAELKNQGTILSEKVVRRIMNEERLEVRSVSKKKYNSYAGEISSAVPNLLMRDFKAEKPNKKWLTDITEFRIPAGKVYLSPIVGCFDGAIVSWSISTEPNAELVNSMFDQALETVMDPTGLIVHTDRGAHYRWPGWLERITTHGLTQSMSKKGCSPDNAACEGFFGRLKNEMFYGVSWKGISTDEFIEHLDQYVHWYNEKRIKMSLGGISPVQYRRRLDLIA